MLAPWVVFAVVATRWILRRVPAKPEPRVHRRGLPEDRRPVFGYPWSVDDV